MTKGLEFKCYVPANVQSVEEVKAYLAPVFAEDVKIAVYSMEYDFAGRYNQSVGRALTLKVEGQAWSDKKEEPKQAV